MVNSYSQLMDIRPWGRKDTYTLRQWAMWELLLDITNAVEFRFNRFPMPGEVIDVAKAEEDTQRIENEWNKECLRRDTENVFSGAPKLNKMDLNKKLNLHSLMKEHRNLPETPPRPQDGYTWGYF